VALNSSEASGSSHIKVFVALEGARVGGHRVAQGSEVGGQQEEAEEVNGGHVRGLEEQRRAASGHESALAANQQHSFHEATLVQTLLVT